jgi:uncharacterized protein YdhG (YjbR/CyaY superfamily)
MKKDTSNYGTKKDSPDAPAKDVNAYLAAVPLDMRVVLEKLRQTIKAAAPMAEEVISYRIPTYKYHGPLVHFAAFKDHCSFIVVNKSILELFNNELKPYDTSGTTIHFSAENSLPTTLITKIVKVRIKENELRAKSKQNKKN